MKNRNVEKQIAGTRISPMTGLGHVIRLKASIVILMALVAVMSQLTRPLGAQSLNGAVVGTVTDPAGAIIAGASVTLTDIGTNEKHTAVSSGAGEYRFVNLLPSNYRLEVENSGFKRLTRQPINVQVGGEVRIDVALQTGAVTETVTVEATTPLLQTESGTQSSVVEGKVVQEMPLNGRNTMNLIALTPSVVPQGETAGSTGANGGTHTDNLGWGNYEIGGAIAGEGAEYLDGGPINVLGSNGIGLVPTQDAIQEFRVSTNAVNAEFGRFGGGVVEMSTKSGSNQWHGTAYEYLRNTVLNSNFFFNKLNNQPRSPFHQNQYGAAASGPIKKNKVFFFGSWESFTFRVGSPFAANVPTADMDAGKFYGKTLNTSAAPAGCITNGLSDGQGTYAQIDPSCFDPTAKVILGYFPAPNATTSALNYFTNSVVGDDNMEYVGRIDYNISDKQRIFGRYSYWKLDDIAPDHLHSFNGFPTGYASPHNRTHSIVLGDNYLLNPSTVLDVEVAYLRQYFANTPPGLNKVDQSQFGPAYSAMSTFETYKELPNAFFAGPDGLPLIIPMDSTSSDYYDNLSLDANLTKTIGRHSLKLGGEVRYMDRSGVGSFLAPSGLSIFMPGGVGDEVAALFLGEPLQTSIQTGELTTTYNYSQGYYLTDAWQVNPKLTVNLGLRWELPGGLAEKKDRTTVLLPNTVDPTTGDLGAVALTNSSLYHSRSMIPIRHDLFSPRISFAQSFGNSMVVRGGFGLNYLSPDLPYGVMAYNSPVNFTSTQAFGSYHSLSDPFNILNGGKINTPVGRSDPTFSNTLLGQVVTGSVPEGMPYPYIEQWNLAVSKQWTGSFLTELSYVGSKGTHLPNVGAYNSNNVFDYMGLDELSSKYYPELQAMKTAGATDAAIEAYGQSLRPYPQFQDYVNTAEDNGSNVYHALYATVQKRFRNGGVINANYAWSKNIGDTDTTHFTTDNSQVGFNQDFNNTAAERSLMSFDVRNRLVIDYVIDLPFGKGQRFANFNGFGGALVSGWEVNGITTFQTGFPLPISYNGNYLSNYFGAGTIRPNYIAGCNKKAPGTRYQRFINNDWFNAACFTYPGDFAFGNEPRVDSELKAQGIDNFDFSASKDTKIRDHANLQFRAEVFNLFNHTQFYPPGTQMGGSNYNTITAQYNQPRLVQLSLRLKF